MVAVENSPYSSSNDYKQVWVTVSDTWYNSQEYEKKRFAETVRDAVEYAIKHAGVQEKDATIVVDFYDTYGELLAEESIWTGNYEIKQ